MIARVLSSFRSTRGGIPRLEVVGDKAAGTEATRTNFAPAGDDSPPLAGDFMGGPPSNGAGRGIVSGYIDPVNPGVATEGEVRRYARDTEGAIVAVVYLRGDGSLSLQSVTGGCSVVLDASGAVSASNGAGSFGLDASGNFLANGAKIDPAGEIENAAGVKLGTHKHPAGALFGDSIAIPAGPVTGITGGAIP
jgi:hypothetical protein